MRVVVPSHRLGACARIAGRVVGLALVLFAGGCQQMELEGKPLLHGTQMSPRTVVLDLFFVRVPFADPAINGPAWQQLDEQQVSEVVRRRLDTAGIRAGVSGLHAPPAIESLLAQNPRVERPQDNVIDDLTVEPIVLRRHLQLPPGKPTEVLVSGIYESLPLLDCDDRGQVTGQTYKKAQGVLTLTARPAADGRVRLTLRPELHHGDARTQIKAVPGVPTPAGAEQDAPVLLEARRDRKIFDPLTIDTTLTAGEMLVLTCRPGEHGTLGHSFFTESTSAGLNQKLLIVRLSQTQHDALFEIPDAHEAALDRSRGLIADPLANALPDATDDGAIQAGR